MGLLWLVRSVWLRLASEEIMFSMMRSCVRLRVVAHKPLLALLHAYTRLARTTAQGLMSDAKASPVASEVQFNLALSTARQAGKTHGAAGDGHSVRSKTSRWLAQNYAKSLHARKSGIYTDGKLWRFAHISNADIVRAISQPVYAGLACAARCANSRAAAGESSPSALRHRYSWCSAQLSSSGVAVRRRASR